MGRSRVRSAELEPPLSLPARQRRPSSSTQSGLKLLSLLSRASLHRLVEECREPAGSALSSDCSLEDLPYSKRCYATIRDLYFLPSPKVFALPALLMSGVEGAEAGKGHGPPLSKRFLDEPERSRDNIRDVSLREMGLSSYAPH